MTGGEWTGRRLLAHVQPPEQLDPEVSVNHVVHVVPVGHHRLGVAQLAVEEDAVLAEDVPRDADLPAVPGLDHDVVVSPGLLQAAAVLVSPVSLLSIPEQPRGGTERGALVLPVIL